MIHSGPLLLKQQIIDQSLIQDDILSSGIMHAVTHRILCRKMELDIADIGGQHTFKQRVIVLYVLISALNNVLAAPSLRKGIIVKPDNGAGINLRAPCDPILGFGIIEIDPGQTGQSLSEVSNIIDPVENYNLLPS